LNTNLKLNQVLNHKADCSFSLAGGCRLINSKLGFPVGLPQKFCETCLEGGVSSEKSTKFREQAIDNVHKYVHENPKSAEKVNAYVGWKKSKISWANATSWLKSEVSKVTKTLSLDVLNQRKESCFGSVSTEACSMLRKHTDGYHYCGSCGCGIREEARLDGTPSKLEYPYHECPLRRPGFSNHESIPVQQEVQGSGS
jgi:hypothetical protein